MEAEKAVQFPIDRAHSVNEDVRTKKGNVRIGVSNSKKNTPFGCEDRTKTRVGGPWSAAAAPQQQHIPAARVHFRVVPVLRQTRESTSARRATQH